MKTQTVDEHADAIELRPATSSVLSFGGTCAAYRIALPAAILLLTVSLCLARNAGAQQAAMPSQSAGVAGQKTTQVVIPAFLTASLDSKKRKAGDEVVLKTAGAVHLADGTVIPKGAKVVGHVTEAKARSGSETESSLGIEFDKIDLAEGKTLAIKGVVQAAAPNPNSESGGGVDYSGMNQTLQHATPSAGGTVAVAPVLTEQSVGVQGIKNLQLGSDGVFKTDGKSVKLDYGSQIVLRAQTAGGQ
ncbi:MAG TPA: hypothetical protein VKR60_14030 [Candidatus Sulfotelmatobacter sp.]|nr:hypothetical protein [Candidatus Sulfotelmatobacter sp.]